MTQVNESLYEVNQGDNITITAELLNGVTPAFLQVKRNGVDLQNLGGATPRYQFTIERAPVGNEVVDLFCNFPGLPADPDPTVTTQVKGAPGPGPQLSLAGSHQTSIIFHVIA